MWLKHIAMPTVGEEGTAKGQTPTHWRQVSILHSILGMSFVMPPAKIKFSSTG